MITQRIKPLLLVLLATALSLSAGDSWKDKPYTEWSQSDVNKVLEDSPWARSILFQGNLLVDAPEPGGPRLTVRWDSALTVRQAVVRREELARQTLDKQAVARYLSTTPPGYVIVVVGSPLTSRSLQYLTEEVLRESSYLELRSSKQKVKPSAARLIRQGAQLVGIEIHFPREIDGKPTITVDEKRVTFYCGMSSGWVTTDFDFSKMALDGKPDL